MIVLLWEIRKNLNTGQMKMNKKINIILTAGFLLLVSVFSYGSDGQCPALKTRVADSSEIFINGWEYNLQQAANGHPFVFSKIWQYGKINSDLGIRKDLLMNYDIYQDVLLIQIFRNNQPYQIVLNPEYINSFEIDKHLFINPLKFEGFQQSELSGYYELIYDSEIKFFLKRVKKYSGGDGMEGSSYNTDIENYIYANGQVYRIKNRRSIYRIYPDHKKDIKKYMRRNRILLKNEDLSGMSDFMRFLENLAADE
mgnify:FL=1